MYKLPLTPSTAPNSAHIECASSSSTARRHQGIHSVLGRRTFGRRLLLPTSGPFATGSCSSSPGTYSSSSVGTYSSSYHIGRQARPSSSPGCPQTGTTQGRRSGPHPASGDELYSCLTPETKETCQPVRSPRSSCCRRNNYTKTQFLSWRSQEVDMVRTSGPCEETATGRGGGHKKGGCDE